MVRNLNDEYALSDGNLDIIYKQWKFDKYYEEHPDEFAEQYLGCKLLPHQKLLLKALNVKDDIKTLLYPKRNGYAYLMFVYKVTEFILSDSKSMVFLCGSDIDKHYKEIIKFTNGSDITVTMRKDKEMITLEKQHKEESG